MMGFCHLTPLSFGPQIAGMESQPKFALVIVAGIADYYLDKRTQLDAFLANLTNNARSLPAGEKIHENVWLIPLYRWTAICS